MKVSSCIQLCKLILIEAKQIGVLDKVAAVFVMAGVSGNNADFVY
jgi:hypothetical protein